MSTVLARLRQVASGHANVGTVMLSAEDARWLVAHVEALEEAAQTVEIRRTGAPPPPPKKVYRKPTLRLVVGALSLTARRDLFGERGLPDGAA